MRRGRSGKRAQQEQDLIRFGISIPDDLLKKFDQHLQERNNQNRSQAIRDLIRDRLVQEAWSEGKGEQVATVTLIYDNQNSDVQRRMTETQRSMGSHLMSTMKVRLGGHHELEVLVLRGPAGTIRTHAETILALKGILHGKLVMTTA